MSNQKIAIIGISGKYPGADNVDELWENLKQGKDTITEVPKSRWDHTLYYQAGSRVYGKSYSKWGGFINGMDQFDSLFFNIAPKVAELTDPQERQFLQCAYHTIEDAGYSCEGLSERGPVGVFCAVEYNEYLMYSQANTPVSALNASITNRVSYYCNFTGPSITIDTMCSGSISSVHLACQSIQNGECSAAIAGGVNLTLHPNKFILHGAGRFSSKTGRCHSFGDKASGYVASEGVGAVLLKPLADAVADGDHIYGEILATAINHGGTSRTYTVPKASSQAAVISKALEQTALDPISYIEAHGSGTALGDVIEVDGLQRAYSDAYLAKDEQGSPACLIGSIKSNIGHCESAAGIAGLTKVLLQMRYKTIVPSIHSQIRNPYIDFENSPFEVPCDTQPWRVASGQKRVAGISAFGAGGSNAHMVVQEYVAAQPLQYEDVNGPSYILLSAKAAEQLQTSVKQLYRALERETHSIHDVQNLPCIAFTLQVGRTHHEHRLALSVNSIDDLKEQLAYILDNRLEDIAKPMQTWLGEIAKGKALEAFVTANNLLYADLLSAADWPALIELWVQGYPVDWQALYHHGVPNKVSLPGYPFAKQRFWVPNTDVQRTYPPLETLEQLADGVQSQVEHKVSYLQPLQSIIRLTGNESFIAQHVVNGMKILPGMAYLELIREAIGRLFTPEQHYSINNITWRRPMIFHDECKQVVIELSSVPEGTQPVRFRIYDMGDQQSGDYCRGYVQLCSNEPPANMANLQQLLATGTPIEVDKKALYSLFSQAGLEYGPAFRAVESLQRSEQYVIGQLCVQQPLMKPFQSMAWPPELLDAALHCILGFYFDEQPSDNARDSNKEPMVPFALASVREYTPLPESVWVILEAQKRTDSMQNIDLSLCDEQGNVCLQMIGYTARVMKKPEHNLQAPKHSVPPAPEGDMKLLAPTWHPQPLPIDNMATSLDMSSVWIVLLGDMTQWHTQLSKRFVDTQIHCLNAPKEDNKLSIYCAQSYQYYAQALLEILQQALQSKENKPKRIQLVVSSHSTQRVYAGLLSMLETGTHEHVIKLADMIMADSYTHLEAQLMRLGQANKSSCVDLGTQQSYVRRWQLLPTIEQSSPWKEEGVYLITGGLGGLGKLFTQEILSHTQASTVILWGRGELNSQRQQWITQCNAAGERVFYQAVDITQLTEVEGAIAKVLDMHSDITGILHAAGVLQDGMIVRKSAEHMHQVLVPKVQGLLHLDHATRKCALDFFTMFSSISSALGAPGQADYAAANGFMDWFAHDRAQRVAVGECAGHTLSINWPLWQDGGMRMPRHAMRELKETSGLLPLPSNIGFEAFYYALAANVPQVLVLYGTGEQYKKLYNGLQVLDETYMEEPQHESISAHASINDNDVISAVSTLLKVPQSSIDATTAFFDIGFDSVSISELAIILTQKTGVELSPTVFYECTQINELTHYLQTHMHNKIVAAVEARTEPVRTRAVSSPVNAQLIIGMVSELLKVPESSIDPSTAFADIGFDSVSLGELAATLSDAFGIEISATLFYECTVVAELVDYLLAQLDSDNIEQRPQFILSAPVEVKQTTTQSMSLNDAHIITVISSLLKVPESSIDADTTFEQIGFDSVSLSELAGTLAKRYDIEISTTVFYECTTVGALTQHINAQLGGKEPSTYEVLPTSSLPPVHIKERAGLELSAEITSIICEMLKIGRHDFDDHTPLGQLGFDSVSFAELSQKLSHRYGKDITPTIFYAHETISALVDYLSSSDSDDPTSEPSSVGTTPTNVKTSVSSAHARAESQDQDSIAIIGMDGQFPGAADISQFWDNLERGKDCVTEIPSDRWDWRDVYGDTREDAQATLSKWGGFLSHIDQFDAAFFGISSYEARQMDPQQRLLLQSAWHAIENAGYAPESLSGSNTGVYIGIAHTSGYSSVKKERELDGVSSVEFSGPINAPSLGPNRISYFLNLKGPSEPVETACSSSLVALHRAVTALRSNDCELCLVGGINVIVTAQGHINLSRAGLLSEAGQCRSFAANADGYVRSEGVATVLLKRLSAAERDGDNILAVIRNSKVGYTGKGSGFAAPNTNSQAALIKTCYEEKNIDPAQLSYIEAQGTGTEIGDAVEFQALRKAFKGTQLNRCALASVKTHVGHMEMASGMASLLKVILQMQHNRVVANLHCDELNPHIDIADSPFYIPPSTEQWEPTLDNRPRMAGINAFGFGGVNAHVILEQYQPNDRPSVVAPEQPYAMLLSAKTLAQVETQASNLLALLAREPQLDLYRIAYTLQVGRSAMEERVAMVVHSKAEFVERLTQISHGDYKAARLYKGSCSNNAPIITLLHSDASLQSVVNGWLRDRNLPMLASLWCNGLSVAWQNMYQGETVVRVSLPGYPFEPTRYWIGESGKSQNILKEQPKDSSQYSKMEQQLLTLAQDVLADHEQLSITGELKLAGFSSLELLLWQQRIQDTLNIQVSTELLATSSSIRVITERLIEAPQQNSDKNEQGLVALSDEDAPGPSLICVPAAGAMLTSFYPLAKQLKDCMRLYGFSHRGLNKSDIPHDSIQAMAQDYVSQLPPLSQQQTIYLLGHSLGASVVYEMACLLRNFGHKVHIFMLDSQLYAQGDMSLSDFFQFFIQDTEIAKSLAHKQAHGEDVIEPLTQALLAEVSASAQYSHDYLQQLMRVYAQQILMGLEYIPSQKYDGDITLLLAQQGHMDGEHRQQTLAKYRRYCLQDINIVSVSGGHYSVLANANVSDLAHHLRQTIPSSVPRHSDEVTYE
uniref:SDR family NAD(P)-dependent oxidoreductase n=1 Tax=Pseudoalteromonas sp. (strain SANK 73390) TaxID=747457 RepID=UPI0002117298|nr:SDR family NAD(P)-dependent oxidoreductase [Pseudoalteromonas sp. SANK 73390]CBK62731.1 tmpB [Pseudoalteromonas sp. SANK 73390]